MLLQKDDSSSDGGYELKMNWEWIVVGLFWGSVLLYLTWEAINQPVGLPGD